MGRENRVRKVLFAAAALVALMVSGPMLPVELAVWFSGELLLYLEVISAVWLSSQATSWKSSIDVFRSKGAGALRYIEGGWMRSHPSAARWVNWTFSSI
jgi:hypothetical protein